MAKSAVQSSETLEVLRPDLNGLMLRQPGDPAYYLIDTGHRRHVAPQNLQDVFIPNYKVEPYDISNISVGSSMRPGARLIRADGTERIYLLDVAPEPGSTTICKRPIIAYPTFVRYQFDAAKILNLPLIVVEAIPTGPEVPPPTLP